MTISPERSRGAIDLEPLERSGAPREDVVPARGRRRVSPRRILRSVVLLVLVGAALGAVVVSFTGLPAREEVAVKLITSTVKRGDAATQISGSGVVEPSVRTELTFGTTTTTANSAGGGTSSGSGTIVVSDVAVKIGQRVRRGQVLATLDRSSLDLDVSAAQQSFDAAVAARDEPATTTQDGTTTQDQTDEALDLAVAEAAVTLRAAKDARDAATIVAPHAGIVDDVNLTRGSAPSSSEAAVVLRGSGMRVSIDVAEDDIVDVKVGQTAKIHVVALDADVEGTVTAIDVDDTTTATTAAAGGAAGGSSTSSLVTFPVDVVLASSPNGLRAGMSADVVVTTASRENVLLVPVTAIVGSGDTAQARIPGEDGAVTTTPVAIGLTTSSTAELTSGLAEGDQVVTGIVRPRDEDEDATQAGGLGGIAGGGGMGVPPGGMGVPPGGMGGPPVGGFGGVPPGAGGGRGGGAPRG